MDSKCRETQGKMLDWYYGEQEDQDWDRDHVKQCKVCQNYYQQLLIIERDLPRSPLEFQASDVFAQKLAEKVREERIRIDEQADKKRVLKELGAFPIVAFLLLLAMGALFYYDIGPSFIQVQLVGLILFPLIIPILGVVEKKRQQGRDSYGS